MTDRLAREQVYDELRGAILSCELRPGVQLQERDLADRFGVSKSPVRDALLRLQEQDLVEVIPRKGYRITPISISAIAEMYEMRLLLERACVERLAEHGTAEDLRSLDEFRTVSDGGDLQAWTRYNRRFHVRIAEACGNRRLAKAARDVIEQFDRLTFISVTAERQELGNVQRFVAEHVTLIEALQDRDKRAAAAMVRSHLEHAQRSLRKQLGSAAVIP